MYKKRKCGKQRDDANLLGTNHSLMYHLIMACDDPRRPIQAEAGMEVVRLYLLDAPIIEDVACVLLCQTHVRWLEYVNPMDVFCSSLL